MKVPAEKGPQRVLVPVSGSEADESALRMACGLTRHSKGKVHVVYVLEVERSLPLNTPPQADIVMAEEVLERMDAVGREEKCPLEAEILQAREAGPAIVEEAILRDVDLIVMGLAFRKHRGEFGLGITAPYVLTKAPCRVWITREPLAIPVISPVRM